ncbi:MAG: radical SAM protein [bacterium]
MYIRKRSQRSEVRSKKPEVRNQKFRNTDGAGFFNLTSNIRNPKPCHLQSPSERLFELTLKENIPLLATIELTRSCPLSCSHCYLPETRGRAPAASSPEMGTAAWKKVLEDLAASGCMNLVFTGGEPLLRADIAGLCSYAKELDFDVRIFTSGHGLTYRLARELASSGVSCAEISVYGRKEIHDAITGSPGAFEVALASACRLNRLGMRVKLKTPLMKDNAGEADFIFRLAEENGFGCSFDAVIAPGNDGDKKNLGHRLEGAGLEKVLADERLSAPILSATSPLKGEGKGEGFNPDAPLCGAGRNVCGISPYGNVFPCLQIPLAAGNLREKSFRDIWNYSPELLKMRGMRFTDLEECPSCALKEVCDRCPGLALLEDGNINGPSKAACETAAIRWEQFKQSKQHRQNKHRRAAKKRLCADAMIC